MVVQIRTVFRRDPQLIVIPPTDDIITTEDWTRKRFIEQKNYGDTIQLHQILQEFQRTVTFTSTSETVELLVSEPFELQRIGLSFGRDFKKSFNVDVYAHKEGAVTERLIEYSESYKTIHHHKFSETYLFPQKIYFNFKKVLPNDKVYLSVLIRELLSYSGVSIFPQAKIEEPAELEQITSGRRGQAFYLGGR